jgi:hypothetical protein
LKAGISVKNRTHPLVATILIVAASFLLGCNTEAPSVEAASRLQILTGQYMKFTYGNRGRAPKDEAEFKQYLQKREQLICNAAGITTLDELFVSERDGQPLKIYYGDKVKKIDGIEVVAHEAQGVDGRVMVGQKSGVSELRDAAKFGSK